MIVLNQLKEVKKSNFKTRIIVLTSLIALTLLFISYGYFYISANQSDRDRLTGGCFNPTFTDGQSISLTNAVPMTNEEGLNSTPYDFTLTNSCQTNVKYYVILNIKDGSMDPKNISVSYDGETFFRVDTLSVNTKDYGKSEGYTTSYVLKQDLLPNGSKTEHIRLWLNNEADYTEMQSKSNTFTAEVKIVEGVGSFFGTDKILSLVKGADTSSTDIIDKGTIGTGSTACTNTLAYDGTVDNNLRYVGANPCNYVSFNNELWRIIGVMNNIDDGEGNLETRIKLVRKINIGYYSWDTSDSNVHSGYGINDWTQADLMRELNGDYLDTSLNTNTMWYNGTNNLKEETFSYNKRLKALSQELTKNAKWSLGGLSDNKSNRILSSVYTLERGTNVWGNTSGQTCDDGACPRATSWTGKVALMYLSDFGYAVGDEMRDTCLETTIDLYDDNNCSVANWINVERRNQWTLTAHSIDSYRSFFISNSGGIGYTINSTVFSVHPTLYLKPSVNILSGNGSEENPYILE